MNPTDQKINNMLNDTFDKHYADIQDVKKELTQYMSHEFTDTELIVSWVLGNKIDMGDTIFDLQEYYASVEAEAKENNSIHFWPDGDTNEMVFHYSDYVGDFEYVYVKDYFEKNK